jgi:hypothetical protein
VARGEAASDGEEGTRRGRDVWLHQVRPRTRLLDHAAWIDVVVTAETLLLREPDDVLIRNASLDYYQKPPNNYDEEALDELMRVWRSLSLTSHFMLIYELLTGQVRLKIDKRDSGAVLGALLLRSLPQSEWRDGEAPLVALLLILTRQRTALAELHAPGAGFTAAVTSATSAGGGEPPTRRARGASDEVRRGGAAASTAQQFSLAKALPMVRRSGHATCTSVRLRLSLSGSVAVVRA